MLLFLLTAREGRLSANPPRLSVIREIPDAPRPSHTSRAVALVRLALSPSGVSSDKTGNIAGLLFRH